MTTIKLFTLYLDTEEARQLKRRLGTWNIKYEQKMHQSDVAMINEHNKEFQWTDIQTRDQLFRALHENPTPKQTDPDPEPTTTVDDETTINNIVTELIEKGDKGINDYMTSLNHDEQIQFVVGARLQRHYDAHMVIDAGEMINDMLRLKAKNLDPWMK